MGGLDASTSSITGIELAVQVPEVDGSSVLDVFSLGAVWLSPATSLALNSLQSVSVPATGSFQSELLESSLEDLQSNHFSLLGKHQEGEGKRPAVAFACGCVPAAWKVFQYTWY